MVSNFTLCLDYIKIFPAHCRSIFKEDGMIEGRTVKYDGVMDPECIPLCNAINRMPGIETMYSCNGYHRGHKGQFYIFSTPPSGNYSA